MPLGIVVLRDMLRVLPSNVSTSQVQLIRQGFGTDLRDSLSRCQYVALWVFMMLLHVLSSVFLLCSAKLYWLMDNECLGYFAGLLAAERDRHFRVVGTALGILGTAHGLQLLSHLGASSFARTLKVRPLNLGLFVVTCFTFTATKLYQFGIWVINCCGASQNGERCGEFPSSVHQADESSNEYYGRIFAFRKTVEIATQIPNGYLYSTLIARSWINHTKVALLVANCWSAFIIHQMMLKRDPGDKKQVTMSAKSRTSIQFCAVIVDALLATATSIVLPSVIILPYALAFDFENLTFPDAMLYGDTSFPNLVLENRAFFFMSWTNAAMKAVPHLSAFLCLETMASMLHSSCQTDAVVPKACPVAESHVLGPNIKHSIVTTASNRVLMRATESVRGSMNVLLRVHRVTIPMLLLVTGGIVLGLHLSAQYGTVAGDVAVMEDMCLQRMHPWFASNFSCAVVKYNCYKENVTSPSLDVLRWLARDAVRKIIFLHCSEFIMPPIIREFPSLVGVELWNTTLVEWGEESTISAELHPMMLYTIFVYVNLTGIPLGLLQSPLPEQLTDLEFIHTNLTTLPEAILEPWSGIEIVYIEHSQVNLFPSELMQLPVLSELSLIDNKLVTIPEDTFFNAASTYFYTLALSKNPLRELPPARRQNFDISYLAMEFTLLTEVPAWVATNVWNSASLGGSPLCLANDSVDLAEFVLCGQDEKSWDPLGDERYPTDFIKPYRSLDA